MSFINDIIGSVMPTLTWWVKWAIIVGLVLYGIYIFAKTAAEMGGRMR